MKNYMRERRYVGHNARCVIVSVSVAYVLWDCLAKLSFKQELSHLLGSLLIVEKTRYTVGSELWEVNFSALLCLVRYIYNYTEVDVRGSKS